MNALKKITICALFLIPFALTAADSATGFDTKALDTQANAIKDFLFGTPIKVAGIFGGAFGLLQAIITSSLKPILFWGGIALGANLIPKFLEIVFN